MKFSAYGRFSIFRNLKNEDIKLEYIPDIESNYLSEFAHSLDFYEYHGSFKQCAEIANFTMKKIEKNDKENLTLTGLRTCLFFEFRASRHTGCVPDKKRVKKLLELIRKRVEDGRIE